eukprot:gene7024-8953_t
MGGTAADGFGRLATAKIKAKPAVGGSTALPGGSLALKDYIFTSESVSEGHPDKVADQISDAILDAFIANDVKLGHADDSHANTRLGCETLVTTNKIVIAGEGRASEPFMKKYGKQTVVNREAIGEIARNVVRDIGYDQDGFSFHGADVEVLLH